MVPPADYLQSVDENDNVKMLVESITPVEYSASGLDYTMRESSNKCLLVEMAAPHYFQKHTFQSWSDSDSKCVALLQSLAGSGCYGCSANSQYVSQLALAPTYPMNVIFNNLNHIRVRLSYFENGVVQPASSNPGHTVGEWAMSLVFLRYRQSVDRPVPVHDPHVRLWFSTADRRSGDLGRFRLPLRIDYDERAFRDGAWCAAVEHASTIRGNEAAEEVLSLRCPTLTQSRNDQSESMYDFIRCKRAPGTDYYGERLVVNSWLTPHHLGHKVTRNPRETQELEFELVDGLTGGSLADPSAFDDFLFCLTLYKVRA